MAYFLSKILPLAVLPFGLSLILLLLGLVCRWRWSVLTAALLLWMFSLGIVSQGLWRWLEAPWHRRPAMSAPRADAIVVLSGGRHPAPGAARVSEWQDPDRFLAGIDLYRAGKAPFLFFTGGVSPFLPGMAPEGQRYLHEASQFGVPAAAMASTPPVVNTAEEAIAILELLQRSHSFATSTASSPRILLVTSAFHMQRAQKVFEQQGFIVRPFPVDFKSRGKWAGSSLLDPTLWVPNAHYLASSSAALREIIGRIVYKAF